MISALRNKSKFEFRTFLKKKNQIFGFPWCSSWRPFYWCINYNVGLILTKLRWFQLFATSQNSNFKLLWKKNRNFGFPWCSTCEELSIDVSITNVGLILTKLMWFQLFAISQNSNFKLFWKKKIEFLGFLWCSTREDLSIDVSITNVGLILTKLWWLLTSFLGVQINRRTDTVLESS